MKARFRDIVNITSVVVLLVAVAASSRACGDGDMTAAAAGDSFSYQTTDYECREYRGTVTCKGRSSRYE